MPPLRLRIGTLFAWTAVDRCRLLIALTIPFAAAYALRSAYVLTHPNVEPYYDRGALVWVQNGLLAACAFWILFLAWGSLERRRAGPRTVYLLVGTLSWWIAASGIAYVLGPITSPAWIAVVIGGVVNLLLLPFGVALLGIGVGISLVVTSVAFATMGLIPYAPVFAGSPPTLAPVAVPYAVGNTIVSVVATLVVLGIVTYIVHRWRDALVRLEQMNADLEETIESRTRELILRKRAEQQSRDLEVQMQQTQKLESLGVLAGGIAHDFNNLLTPILGNARLLDAELDPDSPAHRFIDRVETAALRASELTDELLAYAGRGKVVSQRVNLAEVLREMVDLLRTAISRKVEFNYELPDSIPMIDGDPAQLRQVVMNLITNASEAVGDETGMVTIRARGVTVDHKYLSHTNFGQDLPEGLYVALEVTDTGCGMNEETKVRIFDPFFTTKFRGRGLGMAAVAGIVRGHRGALKIESERGMGTKFELLFPSVAGAEVAPEATDTPAVEWRGSGTVLAVDDDEAVREVLEEVIPRYGMSVLTAGDGREAVERFREHAFDIAVVLLDMTMPQMGGMEAFREIRRIRSDVRVVLSSGYSEGDVAKPSGGETINGFLHKPYRPDELMQALRQAMEG